MHRPLLQLTKWDSRLTVLCALLFRPADFARTAIRGAHFQHRCLYPREDLKIRWGERPSEGFESRPRRLGSGEKISREALCTPALFRIKEQS
jgi:hypothetical protein